MAGRNKKEGGKNPTGGTNASCVWLETQLYWGDQGGFSPAGNNKNIKEGNPNMTQVGCREDKKEKKKRKIGGNGKTGGAPNPGENQLLGRGHVRIGG